MKQTKRASLIEAIANVAVGYVVAIISQSIIFSFLGIAVSLRENVVIGFVFTVISLVRSFAIRRVFECLRVGGLLR